MINLLKTMLGILSMVIVDGEIDLEDPLYKNRGSLKVAILGLFANIVDN